MITARALHYVFRIGDRAKNAHFFREVLGMTVSVIQKPGNLEATCDDDFKSKFALYHTHLSINGT